MIIKSLLLLNLINLISCGSTKGQTIADWLSTTLKFRIDGDLSVGSNLLGVYTGYQPNIPLSTRLIDTTGKPSFYSTTQQALYGIHLNLPATDTSVGYETKAYVSYKNPGRLYSFRKDGDPSCPGGSVQNSTTIPSNCRAGYTYVNEGIAYNTSKPLTAAKYDPTTRIWYTTCKNKRAPTWSPLYVFASTIFSQPVPGVSYAVPLYSSSGAFAGCTNVDYSYSIFNTIINGYYDEDSTIYFVETSTFNLVAASNGVNPAASGSLTKASASKTPAIAQSVSYLSSSNTAWKSDGSYITSIDGVNMEVYMKSFTDYTATLNWKVVVVTPTASPTDTYLPDIEYSIKASIIQVNDYFQFSKTPVNMDGFQHGANTFAPLSQTAKVMYPEPDLTGLNQQMAWGISQTFNKKIPNVFVSISTGYSQGTFLGYVVVDQIHYEFYRDDQSATNYCPASGSFPEIPTNCAKIYNVDSNGVSTGTSVFQTSFDPRSRIWYTTTKNYGTSAFCSPYHSAFGNVDQISWGVPLSNPGSTDIYGVTISSVNLAYLTSMVTNQIPSGYTVYLVHKLTGFLIGSNVGYTIYTGSSYTKATDVSNDIIKTSYSYLQNNGLTGSADVTISYTTNGVDTNMRIVQEVFSDPSKTLDIDVVYVQLLSDSTEDVEVKTQEDDDDEVIIASNASIASAVLSGIIIILLIVVLVFVVQGRSKGSSAVELSNTKNVVGNDKL